MRRAFTLIEVASVIAVLLVISALAWPVLDGRLATARMRGAAQQVESALVIARAEAQARGVMVRLVARNGARAEDPQSLVMASVGDSTARDTGNGPTKGERPALNFDESVWELGSGVRLQAEKQSATAAVLPRETPVVSAKALRAELMEDLVIATFLPDGTAVVGSVVYLTGGKDAAEIRINRWTGEVSLNPVKEDPTQNGEDEGTEGDTAAEQPRRD
jgi:prepilin-type N-terminal cleavage/methylation domain-containing protein